MLITRLKSEDTITSLCAGKVFIINCHGCKEVGFPEEEANALQKKLAEAGKVVGTLTTDYVCNPTELALRLRAPMAKIAEADVAFHDIIYMATDNKRLIQLLNNLREQMYRYRIEYLKDSAVRRQLAKEHKAICEALRTHDRESALRYVYVHIDNQQKAIIRSLNEEKEE